MLFKLAQESSGEAYSLRDSRSELKMSTVLWLMAVCNWWMYSEAVHRRSKIEDLAQRFVEALRSIIAHCQSPEAGGRHLRTPPAVELSQDELDEALGMVEFEGDMQDEVKILRTFILYLPCNRMLFHSLFAQHPGCISNNQTMSCRELDISA